VSVTKTAIVHEWFVNYAGSEKCVESFLKVWPEADIYSLVDFLDPEERKLILRGRYANTSFIQKLPFAKKSHRKYLPLFPTAIERFNLSEYKLIISSSHSVAKGVRTKTDQLHLCYCHSPMRYAWDEAEYYLSEANLNSGLKGILARKIINYLRNWDIKSANNVTWFIANSHHIANKIGRIYKRDSDVIYPPVDTEKFPVSYKKENYYLTASRLVPYKRVDIIVEAFARMPDKKLIVAGSGPEKEKLKLKAGPNTEFTGYLDPGSLVNYMQKAQAFVFAAEEDFGIVPIESLSCGTPVVALNKGGTAETIKDGVTGIHFNNQRPEDIAEGIMRFEQIKNTFEPSKLHEYACQFDRSVFEEKMKEYVNEKIRLFYGKGLNQL
jgi:glycosyltransferase involved in cell wall biosynthesis